MTESSHSTLYPKITNHVREIVKRVQYGSKSDLLPIPIIGTVKLHGTHGDVLIHRDDSIVIQSRNTTNLTSAMDNCGFATSMLTKRISLLQLRDQFEARWRELNSEKVLDSSIPVTIAGEWIGEKIQKGVAISQLSKRFVIISVKISGKWVPDMDYKDIESPYDDIYNISRGKFYHSILYPIDIQRTIDELEPLADKVASQCPFAESFGIIGEGEGLVWKLLPYIEDSELWFKTKGGRFKPTFTPAPRIVTESMTEKKEVAEAVALSWCSEDRLEQGWDYLKEKGFPQDIKGIKDYLRWVQQDILFEEKGYITEYKVDEKFLKGEIIRIARPWFMKKLQ